MNVEPKNKPLLRRGLIAFAPSADEIQIQAGELTGPVYHVRDDEAKGHLASFLPLFDGRRSVEEIQDGLQPEQRTSFLELLEYLHTSDLLEPQSSETNEAPIEPLDAWPELQATLGLATGDPVGAFNTLRRSTVAVVATGRLGEVLCEGLGRLGVGRVEIWNAPRGSEEGYLASLNTLAAKFPRTVFAPLDGKADQLGASLAGKSWVLVATERASPSLFSQVNAASLEHDFPWTLAYLDGYDAFAGPSFFPHETACYTCLTVRARGNAVAPILHARYVARNDGALPVGPAIIGGAELVTGLLLLDLPQLLHGRTGWTAGQAIAWNLLAGSAEVESVLRLPRCPSCGKLARGHPIQQHHASVTNLLSRALKRAPSAGRA